jgi:hypothetical protein
MAKQAMRWTEVAGALILCAGVALLSLSRSTKPIGLSFGSFSHWFVAAIIAGIAYIAVQIGLRTRGPARASLTGLAAGLVFGIQDALTRQTLEILQGHPLTALFTNWPPYCLLAAGIVGLWLMQNAFSAGPLHASLPPWRPASRWPASRWASWCSATGSRSRRGCSRSRPAASPR